MEMTLSNNALKVLEKRYLKKDPEGKVVEAPEEMFCRVANNIASADLLYDPKSNWKDRAEEFSLIMSKVEFLPNSPTLMNAGLELQQLAACFVLPIEDSLDSIFETLKNSALIHQSGGGTGFSFSALRPKNDRIMSSKGIASGPLSFIRIFNTATEVIKQGGTRRGANMGILRVDHPDITDFITAKDDPGELINFNISIAITDKFMEAMREGKDYYLINPRTGEKIKRISASKIADLIVESAWKHGEPGVIFIDRINRANPTPHLGSIEATNPCGEQPLLPYEACNLGSINLSRMLKEKDGSYEIDYSKLKDMVKIAVKFLDNVIDMNNYPLPQIKAITKGNRKIGLGVMGFADMLILLGIPYDSQEALDVAEKIMSFIRQTARETSVEIAKGKGVFPNFKGSIYETEKLFLRNATTTTIAPTGTLSIIANCSSGIEPLYALSYVRNIIDLRLPEIHPLFERKIKDRGLAIEKIIKDPNFTGSISNIPWIPEDLKRLFLTAHDISPEAHIKMQAAFQKYTDNAVSKTINLPSKATKDDVKKAFLMAYQKGCKGITVYRSGSRERQVLACANVQMTK